MNALELYERGELRVARAVSHAGEKTLGLCLRSLSAMEGAEKLVAHRIVANVEPVSDAFNLILDFARTADADLLFHTASDVVVDPKALVTLLGIMDPDHHYQAVAKGFDCMFGEGASVGILIWNMRAVGDHRFRDVYKTDMDMSERVEAASGMTRVYADRGVKLGYHHPVWTAEELYGKILYSYQKYAARRKQDIEQFVEEGLARNPENSVMLLGRAALERAQRSDVPSGAKRRSDMQRLYVEDRTALGLPPTDLYYYVHHREFRDYAQAVFRSHYICRTVDDPPA